MQQRIDQQYMDLFKGSDDGLFNALDQMYADANFACDVEAFSQALSKNGNKVYR